MINNYMRQLEVELELEEPFEITKKGVYEYPLSEEMSIYISELNPEGVLFEARLAPFPADGGELFYTEMLEGNLFGAATYDATLGLSSDGKNIVLSHAAPRKIEYAVFRLMLDDFINVSLFWQEQSEHK